MQIIRRKTQRSSRHTRSADTSVSIICHVQLLLPTVYLVSTLLHHVLSQRCRGTDKTEEQEEDLMLYLKLLQDGDNGIIPPCLLIISPTLFSSQEAHPLSQPGPQH